MKPAPLGITLVSIVALLVGLAAGAVSAQSLSPMEQLGKSIFFDQNLSINQNQSCATCHGPEVGFTGPLSDLNDLGAVYEGSILGRFGDRKPPTAAYATLSPIFYRDKKGFFVGGNFWDGRATGEVLGNPAADQALGPFLNPVEQALPDPACVVYRVCNPVMPGDYPMTFTDVWGVEACQIAWPADVDTTCATEDVTVVLSPEDRLTSDQSYGQIGLSIAAYEASPEVNAFSSKYDLGIGPHRMQMKKGGPGGMQPQGPGQAKLSQEERRGWAIFRGKARCQRCHPGNGQEALFTDFTFDNLGLPQNPDNPAGVAPDFVDPGLGGFLMNAGYPEDVYLAEWGKHKVPTLRNVGKGSCEAEPTNPECIVKAYGHNGYFKSLLEIVHFYNTRDVLPGCEELGDPTPGVNCWPAPEVAQNVNTDELGDLGLSAQEEADLVAFLLTLSDGYVP